MNIHNMKKCMYYCLIFVIFLSGSRCEEPSTYTAAVVEFNPPEDISSDSPSNIKAKDELVRIIISLPNDVDIVVLPEAAFGSTTIILPNSTIFCDDPNAHTLLHDISCAARMANKYVVINLYMKIYCTEDDQPTCANLNDQTNAYNMAIVFDRNGALIAKYRKFHLYGEGVQTTEKPDLTTFRTDFNVTFGMCICFDLIFDYPQNGLVERGVRNFVYPTMWFSEIPYLSAVQYQQSWAYANNVNLLAANINWPSKNCTGSGIYAGRLGALESFVSQSPMTKVLIAKVPTILPDATATNSEPQFELIGNIVPSLESPKYETFESATDINRVELSDTNKDLILDTKLLQDDMTVFSVEFLNFAIKTNHKGQLCNGGVCCHYDIEVSDNGSQDEQVTYSYAISAFDGHRHYAKIENLLTGQAVCSLIACVGMDDQTTCGLRYSTKVHHRYSFEKLHLETEIRSTRGMKVMPNTLTNSLLGLNSTEFDFKLSKIDGGTKYAASLSLNVPRSDILTFAIFSRDYTRDTTSGVKLHNGAVILATCIISTIISIKWCKMYHL